ncbi:hypothetical protein [Klebsiella phage UTI-K4]|nr:hypothetical protein [Klebsiella phage UTI-K4]WPH68280.1 anti-restriction nuclease [Klebsiella phage ValerieMcCarty02]
MNTEALRREDEAKAYHKRVELLSAIKVEYTLQVRLKVLNSWANDLEVKHLEQAVMFTFTQEASKPFSLSADFHTYGIITIKAKDRGDIISGVEYIESILGNRGEVVLA